MLFGSCPIATKTPETSISFYPNGSLSSFNYSDSGYRVINENNETFVFYDGPATANGMPGVHHMLAKLLKDSFCKYKTMQGYRVVRKIGLDTHGLPIEVNVEKKLGFKEKTESVKGLGESSNLEFSKLMHEWCRSRATFLEDNNVFMIIVSHQNDKIDMSRSPMGAFMTEEYKAANNKVKIARSRVRVFS